MRIPTPKNRPGLLVRLGHIIVIQVVFVFAAMSLLVLFPDDEVVVDDTYMQVQTQFQGLEPELVGTLQSSSWEQGQAQFDRSTAQSLTQLFCRQENFHCAAIFISDRTGNPVRLWRQSPLSKIPADQCECESAPAADETWLRHALTNPVGALIPATLASGQRVYYYPFEISEGQTAVVVASADHSLLISNKPKTVHGLLVLFLCSTLVSLLTVYLMYRRFQDPLRRLEISLRKTTEGEVFYQLEPTGEPELDRIVQSFNKISKSLYEGQRSLRQFNRLIQDAYISNLESQAFLATLIDSSPCCIVATSVDGEIMIFNRKASEVFGFTDKSPVGRQVDELFVKSLDDQVHQDPSNGFSGGCEVVCRRADGEEFPAFLVLAPIVNGERQVAAQLFILLDISESKNFQEMMISVDRYSTRGEMAGDIAHEINNYLAVLSGNIELMPLFLKKGDTEKIDKKLELMKSTVDRISRFADGLMDVNHGDAQFEQTDINQIIQNLLAFLKPQNRFDQIEFATHLNSDLPLAQVDSGQIQQLLVNLIHNAGDALQELDERQITILSQQISRDEQAWIRIEVADNGPGVPEDRREQLFENRFTTKRKGHGYGLVTCRRIIDGHSGTIGYSYQDGSKFYFELPVDRVSVSESTEAAAPSNDSVPVG